MKTTTDFPDEEPVSRAEARRATHPLNLTPEQIKRETAKLHELREDLEDGKRIDDTSARSSPMGRSDE